VASDSANPPSIPAQVEIRSGFLFGIALALLLGALAYFIWMNQGNWLGRTGHPLWLDQAIGTLSGIIGGLSCLRCDGSKAGGYSRQDRLAQPLPSGRRPDVVTLEERRASSEAAVPSTFNLSSITTWDCLLYGARAVYVAHHQLCRGRS